MGDHETQRTSNTVWSFFSVYAKNPNGVGWVFVCAGGRLALLWKNVGRRRRFIDCIFNKESGIRLRRDIFIHGGCARIFFKVIVISEPHLYCCYTSFSPGSLGPTRLAGKDAV